MILSSFFIILLLGLLLQKQLYGHVVSPYKAVVIEEHNRESYMQMYDVHPVVRFEGDVEIKITEEIGGDVALHNGTLWISGKIYGTVFVKNDDIDMDSAAVVKGDIIAINGKIWLGKSAAVTGDVIETASEDLPNDMTKQSSDRKRTARQKYDHDDSFEHQPCWIAYNRVDGLTVGLRKPESFFYARHSFQFFGKGGYSFAAKTFQHQAGLKRYLVGWSGLALGGGIYDLTATSDRWIITDLENAMAAFLIREDFFDYYHKSGYHYFVSSEFGHNSYLRFGYASDKVTDLDVNTG